jgi:hypothetical protein
VNANPSIRYAESCTVQERPCTSYASLCSFEELYEMLHLVRE